MAISAAFSPLVPALLPAVRRSSVVSSDRCADGGGVWVSDYRSAWAQHPMGQFRDVENLFREVENFHGRS